MAVEQPMLEESGQQPKVEDPGNEPKNKRVVILSVISLGLFAFITMGLVFVFYSGTEEKIKDSEFEHEQSILREIVGISNVRFAERQWVVGGEEFSGYLIVPSDREEPQGLVLSTHTMDGYSGRIDLLVGVDLNNRIIAAGIIKHRETPGLGDKIEKSKSDWIDQLRGKILEDTQWEVKKNQGDFDSLSGATISSTAVIKATERALRQSKLIIDAQSD